MQSGDIAEALRIDEDVARLIGAAVKKYVQQRQGSQEVHSEAQTYT